jgi:hypothetical protein
MHGSQEVRIGSGGDRVWDMTAEQNEEGKILG